jgi:hypothetical protein
MSNEQVAPETKGVTVKHLAALDLGPEKLFEKVRHEPSDAA